MDFPLARSATGYPEIWRQGAERRAIALTSPLPFLRCGVFAYVTARLGLHSVSGAVKLAVAVWLIGPLPLILTDAAFMKLHRVFVVSYALGWLIKLTIVAVAVGWFLRRRRQENLSCSLARSDFNHGLLRGVIARLRSRSTSERKGVFSTASIRPRQQINIGLH